VLFSGLSLKDSINVSELMRHEITSLLWFSAEVEYEIENKHEVMKLVYEDIWARVNNFETTFST
jgi:hypothetical protein